MDLNKIILTTSAVSSTKLQCRHKSLQAGYYTRHRFLVVESGPNLVLYSVLHFITPPINFMTKCLIAKTSIVCMSSKLEATIIAKKLSVLCGIVFRVVGLYFRDTIVQCIQQSVSG